MILLIFAAVLLVSLAAFWAAHPFKRDRWLDTIGVGVLFVILYALVSVLYALAPPVISYALIVLVLVLIPLSVLIGAMRRRHLARLVRGVINPHFRDASMRALKFHLEKMRPIQRSQSTRRSAYMLHEHGFNEEAEALLAPMPVELLWPGERALCANDLCAYRLRLSDIAGARAALASAHDPPKAYEPILRGKEALILALEGKPEDSLALAARVPIERMHAFHRATHALARAHAHASRGAEDEARAALNDLMRAAPNDWMERASKPNGPATQLAAALHAERDAPYR